MKRAGRNPRGHVPTHSAVSTRFVTQTALLMNSVMFYLSWNVWMRSMRITEGKSVRCWNIQHIIERGHVNVNKTGNFFVVANNCAMVLQPWNVTFVSGNTCSACGGQNIYWLIWNELDTLCLAFGSHSCTSVITNCALSTFVGVLRCVGHHFWCGHMRNSASFDLFLTVEKMLIL